MAIDWRGPAERPDQARDPHRTVVADYGDRIVRGRLRLDADGGWIVQPNSGPGEPLGGCVRWRLL